MKTPLSLRRALLLLSLTLATLLWLYTPSLSWLWAEWFRPGFSYYGHGPLVAFVCLYLVRRECRDLPTSSPWPGGLALGLVSVILWALGGRLGLPYVTAFSLIGVVLAVVSLTLGFQAMRRLVMPAAMFSLAVPVPIVGMAAQWSKDIVGYPSIALTRLFGVDIRYDTTSMLYIDPLTPDLTPALAVLFPDGTEYWIVGLCSGVNFALAWFSLTLPLLYITEQRWTTWVRVALIIILLAFGAKIFLLTLAFILTPLVGQDAAGEIYDKWLGGSVFLAGWVVLAIWVSRSRKRKDIPLWRLILYPVRMLPSAP